MSQDIDLALVRSFIATLEAGSLSAAALRLGRSQAALSMQMSRLEDDLGCKLLQRSPKGVAPTAAGQVFLLHARQLLDAGEGARRAVSGMQETQTVRLGLLEDFSNEGLFTEVLANLSSIPRSRCDVVSGCGDFLETMLNSGEIDILITEAGLVSLTPVVRRISQLCWVHAPGYRLSRDDDVPLVLYDMEQPCGWRDTALLALDASQRRWRALGSSANLMAIASMVRQSAGMAIMVSSFADGIGLKRAEAAFGLPSLPELTVGLYLSPFIPASVTQNLMRDLTRP